MNTLWGGRFAVPTDEMMKRFNDSIAFDRRLLGADIVGSKAYVGALARVGLVTEAERDLIIEGLDGIRSEFESGRFEVDPDDEDIHTAVERRLGEMIGPAAGKMHTGRSRNDQVSTDLRLYALSALMRLQSDLKALQSAIVAQAEAHMGVIMPGYTHLQQAQPVLLSHWLMSFFWKFQRDQSRLEDAMHRMAVSPLGAGALAGHSFGIDRHALALDLGFRCAMENSMDAVTDRDYVVEFLGWAALVQIHLGNLAEDLVIMATREFGFVEVDEAFSTGSSLMPQKKNPDALELIRGKCGRVIGNLTGLLTVLKGLPSTYNKDLQEDKEALFDVIDTLSIELPIAAAVVRTLKVKAERMVSALDDGLLATDLADYLVRKGVAFRTSHQVVGRVVRRAEEMRVSLPKLSIADFQAIHSSFSEDVFDVFDFERSVTLRDAYGGTAPHTVRAQIECAHALLTQSDKSSE